MALFNGSRDLGAVDAVHPPERLMADRAPADPALLLRLGAVLDGQLSPYALMPPSRALRGVASEVLHGRTGAVAPLLHTRPPHGQHATRSTTTSAPRKSAWVA